MTMQSASLDLSIMPTVAPGESESEKPESEPTPETAPGLWEGLEYGGERPPCEAVRTE